MSESIRKFNSLSGPVSSKKLEKIMFTAQKEGQINLEKRIRTALAHIQKIKKDCTIEVGSPAIEQVPIEILSALCLAPKYHCDEDTPGLGKGVSPDDIYQMITDKMIELIKAANEKDYVKKWSNKNQEGYLIPFNFDSKKPYRGINQLLLTDGGSTILENPYFLTFKQIQKNKGKLIKGSHGHQVVYFTRLYSYQQVKPKIDFGTYDANKFIEWAIANKNKINAIKGGLSAKDLLKRSIVPILKYYNVYNGADVEGIDFDLDSFNIGFVKSDQKIDNNDPRVEIADLIIENFPSPQPKLHHRGNKAFYSPSSDSVTMPPYKNFDAGLDYYRTLLHEFTHATGASTPKRMERDFSGRFGSKPYAKEELTAEFGAVFLSAHAGIMWRTNRNHAAYLKNWNRVLTHLENDNRFFMRAASAAQKATDFILDLNSQGVPAYQKQLEKKAETSKIQQSALKAPRHQGIASKALNSCGRLNPGFQYLKGGKIIKVAHPKTKKKSTPKPQPPPTRLTEKTDLLKNGDPVRLVKNWGKPKKGNTGVINQRIQRSGHDGEPIYNVTIKGMGHLIPGHALQIVSRSKTKTPTNKPKAAASPAKNNARVTAKAGAATGGNLTAKKTGVKKQINNGQYELGLKRPSGRELITEPKSDTQTGQEFSGDHSLSKVPTPKQPPVESPVGTSRMIKAADVANMKFEALEFDEGWGALFQSPAKNMKLAIWGPPKNGKTAGCMSFAAYLTKFGKVLYNLADQGINKSTKDLLELTGLIDKPNAYVTISDTLDDLESDIKELQPDFVFIDMINQHINKCGVKHWEFQDRFIKKYPNTGFILIFEVTKEGKFKGDQGWTHVVDGLVTVNSYIMDSQGRYGVGEMITWPEGAQKFAPKRYAELMADQPIIEIDY